jgi:hypothetical protein
VTVDATDERDQIKDALLRLGLGEEDVGGRERASRVSALRRVEMMTRPAKQLDAEPRQTQLDYPVDADGRFDPSAAPEWWPLRLAWRWTAGSAREAEAIERWQGSAERMRWELAGKPWARSDWQRDRSAWVRALAALRR